MAEKKVHSRLTATSESESDCLLECAWGAYSGSNLDTRVRLGTRYVITGSSYSMRVYTLHYMSDSLGNRACTPTPTDLRRRLQRRRVAPLTMALRGRLPRSSVLNGGVASRFPSLYRFLRGRDPTEIARFGGSKLQARGPPQLVRGGRTNYWRGP